jgi:hypothetical protein
MLTLGPALDLTTWRAMRREMELRHHKWDAQVGDETGLSRAPLLISRPAWLELAGLSETLFEETRRDGGSLREPRCPPPPMPSNGSPGSIGSPNGSRTLGRSAAATAPTANFGRKAANPHALSDRRLESPPRSPPGTISQVTLRWGLPQRMERPQGSWHDQITIV